MYTLGNRETDTNYWHVTMIGAVHDFFDNLPGGRDAYYEELRHFARRLYSRAGAPEAQYFLDKTPGYHVIAHEIGHVFPDAVLIFLWRNPLAMLASSIEVWSDGRW